MGLPLKIQSAGSMDGAVGGEEDGFGVFQGFDKSHPVFYPQKETGGGEGIPVHGGLG